MRKTALALATLAVAAGPFAASSQAAAPTSAESAAGCVTTYASHKYPAPRVVYVDPYGRIVIDPAGHNTFTRPFVYNTGQFVNCVV